MNQRRVDVEARAFDAGFRREVREVFKRGDVFGPAIGIAAVVERVDTDENVCRAEHFRPRERVGKENRVALRFAGHPSLGLLSGASGWLAVTVRAMPPRAANSPRTIARRGAQALTKSLRIRLTTSSLNARSLRNDAR